jgi:hypothetical protein
LLEGYDLSPNIMMPYNPPTYPKLLETAGLRKSKDLLAYYKPIGQPRENASTRAAGRTQRVTIRPIRMQSFDEDVEIVWNLYNSSWERNWGFVPMTHEEFLHEVAQTKPIIRADLVFIGECAGRPVGFALALPNINIALKHTGGKLFPFGQLKILYYLRSIKELRLVALGVMEEFRSTYMAADLYAALIRNAARLGFEHCEMSWILEDNLAATRSLEAMGARPYKKYRIFEWDLRDCPPGSVVRAK